MHLSSMPLRLRPSSFSEGWKGVRDSALAAPNGLEDKHLTRSTLHSSRAPQTVPDQRRPRLSGLRILVLVQGGKQQLGNTMKLYPSQP